MVSVRKLSTRECRPLQVCVTGASGFVGSYLVDKLLSKKFFVRVLTRDPRRHFPDGVTIFPGDLSLAEVDLRNFLDGCDVLINCAGEFYDINKMNSLHIGGVKSLINTLSELYKKRGHSSHFIQLSSVGAYGAAKNPGKARIISEKSPLSPKGEYEITKASADKFVINTCRESSICYTILRPSNIVGVGMPNKSFGALLRAISEGKFFFIGSKSSISNYIHVDDVVDALLICISDDRAKNKVFNLSNDCALSDIVSEVSIFTDINPKPLCVPENLVRFSVWMITKFIKLPLSKSRIDALVSRTSFPSHYIREVLGFIPSKHIPQFAVDYLKYLNETKQS